MCACLRCWATPLVAALERNDGYRAMVVGLAADCCAVGGYLVDDKLLLISFWWRILRVTLHVAFFGPCDLVPFACFFFFAP